MHLFQTNVLDWYCNYPSRAWKTSSWLFFLQFIWDENILRFCLDLKTTTTKTCSFQAALAELICNQHNQQWQNGTKVQPDKYQSNKCLTQKDTEDTFLELCDPTSGWQGNITPHTVLRGTSHPTLSYRLIGNTLSRMSEGWEKLNANWRVNANQSPLPKSQKNKMRSCIGPTS